MPILTQVQVALEATDAELFQEIGKRAYLFKGEIDPQEVIRWPREG